MEKNTLRNLLSPFRECRRYGLPPWQCPQFLFVALGGVIIVSIIVTNIVARRIVSTEVVALIILIVTAILFIISYFIVSSFERVAEASMAKSDFVSIMSHRLRSPLSVIRWRLDALRERNSPVTVEEARAALDDVYKQNEKLVILVGDLLDVNRIEDNQLRLSPTRFSVRDLVEHVIALNRAAVEAKNITLTLHAADEIPNAYADETKIKSVAAHLIDNAVLYSHRGGAVTVEIGASGTSSGVKVKVTVHDQGIGISQDDLRNMFTKFFRAHGPYYHQTAGSGIGLYLAKHIIEASGGEVGVESLEGKGSTFWFTLPAATREV